MKKRAVAFLLCTSIGLLASGMGGHRTAAQQLPLWVTFLFDGGYAYVFKGKKLEVSAFKAPGEAHTSLEHVMILRLERGDQVSGKPPDPGPRKQWTLNGQDVRLASYGSAGQNGVSKPGSSDPGAPKRCDEIADFDPAANNLFFFPLMKNLGSNGKITNDLSRFTARILLDHGRLSMRRVKGCWEFMSENGNTDKRMALVPGLGAIKYNLEPGGDTIELRLSPIGQMNVTDTITLRAERIVEDGVARNEIMIWAGRFPASYDPPLEVGKPMTDFKRYYTLLKNPPDEKKWLIPFKQASATESSPGDECAGVFFQQP